MKRLSLIIFVFVVVNPSRLELAFSGILHISQPLEMNITILGYTYDISNTVISVGVRIITETKKYKVTGFKST